MRGPTYDFMIRQAALHYHWNCIWTDHYAIHTIHKLSTLWLYVALSEVQPKAVLQP